MQSKFLIWIFIISLSTTILNVYVFDMVVIEIIEEQHEDTNTSQSKINHLFHSNLLIQHIKQNANTTTNLDIYRAYMEKLNVLNDYLTEVFSPPDYIV